MNPDIPEIIDLIKERAGLIFNDTQKNRLDLAIRQMMAKNEFASVEKYYRHIRETEKAFHDLVEQLTTSETYFYREPNQIELLVDFLIPGIMQRKPPGEKIKLLSAGCSTGAEPYSLAIAIVEKYGMECAQDFSINGFDIDARSLEKARLGIFTRYAFRGMDPALQKKYFTPIGNQLFQIRPDIARMVRFRQVNLVSEAYPVDFRSADVIFYRNVSIYFDQKKQRAVFQRLSDLLEVDGCLIMSSTEILSHNTGILHLKEIRGIFAFFKNEEGALPRFAMPRCEPDAWPISFVHSETSPELAVMEPPAAVDRTDWETGLPLLNPIQIFEKDIPSAFKTKTGEEKIGDALRFIQNKRYEDALRLIDDVLGDSPDSVEACILKAGVLMQMQRMDQSRDMLQNAIRLDRLCLEGYLLLGFLAKNQGDADDAIRKFKEAIYIAPRCWPAHFHLAELYQHRGEIESARREYKNVMKLIENGNNHDELIFFNPTFSPEQVRHLCRHNLARLATMKN